MPQVCSNCQKVNPPEAIYCFNDGALLKAGAGAAGPVSAGAAAFATPFVFSSGKSCQNFDQLAMACQQNWDEARDMLKQGALGGFMNGIGRADLSQAAQEAAKFPDADRGLDQFLAKLPGDTLKPPQLHVEPTEVNLGLVHLGTDRKIDLQLENQGMRLAYGTIASDSKWLTLGDAPGTSEKIFQFGESTTIPMQIRGQELRSNPKPQEGHLLIEGNTGKPITVKVKLEVPVKPFPNGVLAGAKSPRDVAVKAKSQAREAATMFESGAVEKWFKENGWTYPVQGPAGSGLGAVQQFFEALGLAKPPKVSIDKQSVALSGNAGQQLQTVIKVETQERRPVYAHATANESWLNVSKTKVEAKGRIVLIYVTVPSVPARGGQTLTAQIRVAANGNQRFNVPVALTVGTGAAAMGGGGGIVALDQGRSLPVDQAPIQLLDDGGGAPVTQPAMPAVDTGTHSPVGDDSPFGSFAAGSAGVGQDVPTQTGGTQRKRSSPPIPFFIHLIPLVLLVFALLITFLKDILTPSTQTDEQIGVVPVEKEPRIVIRFDYPLTFYPANVRTKVNNTMNFGVFTTPIGGNANTIKRLTFNEYGQTNSVLLKVNNRDVRVGEVGQGKWSGKPTKLDSAGTSIQAKWAYGFKAIDVTMKIERVPGYPFYEKGEWKRAYDTCRVIYEIKNNEGRAENVGLRIVLDTLIGGNDGAPFSIPGVGLIQTQRELTVGSDLPDFIQVLEKPSIADPGTVVQLNTRIGKGWDAPDRVRLTHWPANNKMRNEQWDIPLRNIQGTTNDSAVVLYWDPVLVGAGKTRKIGFSYGLGHISSETGKLALNASPNMSVNQIVTILARVGDQSASKVSLKLPEGLGLMAGETNEKTLPAAGGLGARPREIIWRAKALASGQHDITATTDKGESESTRIYVSAKGSILGG